MNNTLIICQRVWWDKYYGNTYFTARAIFDGYSYMVPFQYGSGDDSLVRASMQAYYNMNNSLPWGLTVTSDWVFPGTYELRSNPDITLLIDACEVQRRKDMHLHGRMKNYQQKP